MITDASGSDNLPDWRDSFDRIAHPHHYTADRHHEPIDVIEDWDLGYRLGNVVKYISRAGRKGPPLEDLRKARWYLDREIAALERGEDG